MPPVTLKDLTWSEFKKFLREPPGNIFALVIPLTALIVAGITSGNVPDGTSGMYGPTDLSMPGQLAATIAAASFMVIPAPFVLYRQRASRRAAADPALPPFGLFFQAQVLVALAVILIGTVAVLLVGKLAFGIRAPEAPFALFIGYLLSCVSILSIGIVLGAIIPTVLLARAIGLVLFLFNLFMSGSAIAEDQLPSFLKAIGTVMPLTYVRRLLADLWFGQGWNWTAAMVLVAVFIVCAVAAFWLYRGEAATLQAGDDVTPAVATGGRGSGHDSERS